MKRILLRLIGIGWGLTWSALGGDVVINEIMFHPYHVLPAGEDARLEWIELHNRGLTNINLNGWRFSKGVDFTFTNAILPSRGYLVVAANVAAFRTTYPAVTNVVGNWLGQLGNNGETLELENERGENVARVAYASEGDWAVRQRGPIYYGNFRGWKWYCEADGSGPSVELINPALPNDGGQNWAPSLASSGTPGTANDVLNTNVAPLITDVQHFPPIPASTTPVTITARIVDERTNGVSARLHYQDATATYSPGFTTVAMYDDGQHNDGLAGDQVFAAVIPPQPNNTIIEFYVEASDSGSLTRTWPAPAFETNGVSLGQAANALYQVDDSVYNGRQPIYRLIMTGIERQELGNIWSQDNLTREIDAEMNGTFVSADRAQVDVRYRCSYRNRGHGSRARNPHNVRVNFANDRRWHGIQAMNINSDCTPAQVLGSIVFQKAGLPMANSRPVQIRINNANYAQAGHSMWDHYAHNEELGGDFVDQHFPQDPGGNCYRGIRIENGGGYANLASTNYLTEMYVKQNNGSENDYSDIIELIQVLANTPDLSYPTEVRRVLDVEMAMLYFALNTFGDNNETSLSNGWGDDYAMYRGLRDRRFKLMPYDVDSVFSFQSSATNNTIWRAINTPSGDTIIRRFMTWPAFAPIYFATLKRLGETTFSQAQFEPLVDEHLASWVDVNRVAEIKRFAANRVNNILSQIPLSLTVTSALPMLYGYYRATGPSVTISGTANAIDTRTVLVNNNTSTWTAWQGTWQNSFVSLQPGLNRVLVQCLNSNGLEFARTNMDIWYYTTNLTTVASDLTVDTTWRATNGPYYVTGNILLPSETSLTIEPGTTVYFTPGATFRLEGQLLAKGTETRHIRFSQLPGSSATNSWGGLVFSNSADTNQLAYVDIEFAGSGGHSITVDRAILIADHVTFSGTTRGLIEVSSASMHVKNSVFPTIAGAEHIHGGPIPAGGFMIIEGNFFGGTSGLNDIIDFTGAQRPGPVVQVLNNLFTMACDDVLDLDGTDAHIEGNIFLNVHRNNGSSVDTSSAISGGRDGTNTSHLTIVRNLFYDCDHAVLAKEGNYYTIVNNTLVKMTQAAVNFDEPGRRGEGVTPGLGAYLDGNIIWGTATNFENVYVNHPTFGTTQLTVHRCILSGPDYVTNGVGNLAADPRLVNGVTNITWQTILNDFRLRSGSPAVGAGPNGLDIGGWVPGGASLAGEPGSPTVENGAVLTVGGPGITHYKYRVNGGAWSAVEMPVTNNPIVLSNLANGTYTVYAVGKNSAGVWQALTNPTVSKTWTVNNHYSRLMINEVLTRNVTTLRRDGKFSDLIELYNAGAAQADLSDLSITDDPLVPRKYVFRPGTRIEAGQYLVLFADTGDSSQGIYLRFALRDEGEGVYLYDKPANGTNLLDAVVYGLQLPDLSIGRLADGRWGLTRPTFGGPNVAQPVGDPLGLQINEWLARGGALFGEDFIELYNPDPAPVALGGLFLTDNPINWPTQHQVAPLSFIAGGGQTLFWADGLVDNGPAHLNFQLAYEQGMIALFSSNLVLIDVVTYGPQLPDVSFGRSPDGAVQFQAFSQPTPGSGNPGQRAYIVTNATPLISFNSGWRYNDSGTDLGATWRALNYYNEALWASNGALFYHGNDSGSLPLAVQTTLPFYSPQQITFYFRGWFNYTGPTNGVDLVATHLIDDGAVFYLNGEECLRYNMQTNTPISYASFASSGIRIAGLATTKIPATNLVQGLNLLAVEVHQDDGSSSDIAFALSLEAQTYTTYFLGVPVVLNEVFAKNESYTNAAGRTVDWVELFNPSATPVDLSDMSLSDDPNRSRKWVFPPNATILPRSYYVVEFDDSEPYSSVNAGFQISANSGALLFFHRPLEGGGLLDAVMYGIQTADLTVGRVGEGWKLCRPTRGATNAAVAIGDPALLRLNEWMPNPAGGDDWFELYNPGPLPVELSGLHLTDKLTNPTKNRIPALSFIGSGPNAFVMFHADGDQSKGADHVGFKLDNVTEAIGLYGTNLTLPPLVDSITYTNPQNGVSLGRLPDGGTNIVEFPATDSPRESNFLPLSGVVINEALSHTDPPLEDAIELLNLSESDIAIGGWYLSNAKRDLRRYQIPQGTILPPGGFRVYYEFQFNTNADVPPSFALSSARGDEVYLAAADSLDNLTGYRTSVKFGAAANGVSFGRHRTSTGADFTAMNRRTFGQDYPTNLAQFRTGTGLTNAYPLVGPVVINEIHYHPPDVGTNDNVADEFVELYNLSPNDVPLYDPAFPTNAWRLRDAVDFDFPTNPAARITLPPGGFLLVVSFDPLTNFAALGDFQWKYALPPEALIAGPYQGKLENSSDNVELYRPDTPELPPHPNAGLVPYLLVDRIKYRDDAPWPTLADGSTNGVGYSLQRRRADHYGNDPVNWIAAVPSPAAASAAAVIEPPAVLVQPQGLTVMAGNPATFTVGASGAQPLAYQWQWNGVPLPGETNATLVLSNVQALHAGKYTVLVYNPAGAAYSAEARLLVTTPPIITQHPQGRSVVVGSEVIFVVTASGSALQYQWRFNGAHLPGATNSTLALTQVQPTHAGAYDVMVSNSLGTAWSAVATLVVVIAPTITTHPQDASVIVGNTAQFNLGVTGTEPLACQWRWNGANLTGETKATLTLTNVQPSQAGAYAVVVSNLAGAVTSRVATLTVVVPPTVTVVASDPWAAEPGANTGAFTFTRLNGTAGNVADLTVFFTVSGSALPGLDYAAVPDFITIPAGGDTTSLLVTPLDDLIREGDETVIITLTNSLDYLLGSPPAVVTIFDDDNSAPTVSIITPTNGQWFALTPTNIVVEVNVADSDGTVAKVEFFAGTNKVGESATAPFRIAWTNAAYGTNELVARATDDLGATGVSTPVTLLVNRPPMVDITQPANNQSFGSGDNITMVVNALDTDGSISRVDFYVGTTLLASRTAAPFSATLTNAASGTYQFRAVAVDNLGMSATSSVVRVSVAVPGVFDDFEPDIDRTKWSRFGDTTAGAVAANDYGGSVSPTHSLWFGGNGERSATLIGTDTTQGGQLIYYLRIAYGSYSTTWDNAESGQGVVVEYSVNNGASWVEMARYDPPGQATADWALQRLPIPVGAQSTNTLFRWRQLDHDGSGLDHWALDDVQVMVGPSGPMIFGQPQTQTMLAGSTVTFTVNVGGSSPMLIQWRFNGTNLPNATNTTLVLSNITTNHAGTYSVFASNSLGTATSSEATLTVVTGGGNINFRINSLGTGHVRLVDHYSLTYDDRGGIALSDSQVFVTGDGYTARFSANDLSGGARFTGNYPLYRLDGLVCDLKSEKAYALANGASPLTSGGGTLNTLLELDGRTGATNGNRIELSRSISLSSYEVGLFSGYGRIVIHTGSRVYDILLPYGIVLDLGNMSYLNHNYSESWAYWGVAEYFGSTLYLVCASGNYYPVQEFLRIRVPDGSSSVLATFTDLSDLASFVVSPYRNRWYFHYQGAGQFGGTDETLGYADATFTYDLGTNVPPRVTVQPESRQALRGSAVSLIVTAIGSTPLYYQWQLNGTNLPGASFYYYNIANLQEPSVGDYTVVVTNAYGCATSEVASITLGTPLAFVTQPQSQTVFVGTNVTFTVGVSGSAPITYQWRFNGSDIPEATNDTYVLDYADYYANGTYSVRVTNAVSSILSTNATLVVLTPPFITQQPSSRQFLSGMAGRLEVTALGTLPLSYQWRKDGTNLAGATSAVLSLPSVQSNQVGLYNVVITNAYGAITSVAVTLTIPAMDSNTFVILNLGTGGAVVTNTYALSGYPYYDGLAVSSNRVFVNGYNSGAHYALANLTDGRLCSGYRHGLISDLRSQKVYVFGDGTDMTDYYGGNFTSLIELDPQTGEFTTNIITLSQSLYGYYYAALFAGYGRIVVHDYNNRLYDIALPSGRVTSLGTMSQLTYNYNNSWYLYWGVAECLGTNLYLVYVRDPQTIVRTRVPDGDTTVVASFSNLGSMQNLTVSLPRSRWYFRFPGLSQFGGASDNYANQMLGFANASFAFLLPPNQPPMIVDQPLSQTIPVGGNVTFSVLAYGSPPISYQWRTNGIDMAGQTNTSLTLYNVRYAQAGDYSVRISGPGGVITSAVATLTIDYGSSSSYALPLVVMTNVWKYHTNNLDGQAWTSRTYNDAAWLSGPGLLYVETSTAVAPRNTLLPGVERELPPTYYFRTTFNITTNLANATLAGTTMVDDGAIIWLNGNRLQLIRMNAGATYTALATGQAVGANGDAGAENWSWSATNLVQGANILAVEVHQNAANSSDIVWGMSLTANILVPNLPPIITNQPLSQVVAPGTPVTFAVGATGTPTLRYQWRYNGANILGAQGPSYTVTNAQRQNLGFYSVVVRNDYDVSVSQTATLGLNLPPLLSGATLSAGKQFQMNVYANPGANYALDTSSNLANWVPLLLLTNYNGQLNFTDTNTPAFHHRYFRLRQY